MRRKILWPLAIVILIVFGGGLIVSQSLRENASQQYEKTKVPTLFLHGYGSSYRAEKYLVNKIVKAGVTQNVIRANVSANGKVTLSGALPQNAYNPLIEVNFENSREKDYRQNGKWLKNVIVKLQKTYGFTKFNVVAHSMGNMTLAYYMLDNGQNKKLPQLQKQVNIAGHYNGILGVDDTANEMKLDAEGKPKQMAKPYQELLKLNETYPKNQVSVLNIYGDLKDGSDSDGRVSNASSLSEKYLLRNVAKSYQTLEITGKNAQHSKLHQNAKVAQAIINFIWKK
ncbi:MAG: alpha/beta hydrolase [Lactobacillus sp.]|nr:alpha/beta hydrolase [Lactobacillus sp.]